MGGKNFNTAMTEKNKDEWLTPPALIKALGHFDLDPCSPPSESRPWPTAGHHISLPEDGLLEPWGIFWCNKCEIAPNGTDLHAMQQKIPSHHGVLSAAHTEIQRPEIQLSGMREGEVTLTPDGTTERPEETPKTVGGEGTLSGLTERGRSQEEAVSHGQPFTPTENTQFALALDARGLGEVQGGMGPHLRLLRNDRRVDAGSLHSSLSRELSWDSAREHGASLPSVQHKQTTQACGGVVPGQGPRCVHCGEAKVFYPFRIWLNPPYGKETFKWMDKLAKHGDGIALIFARTETKGFHRTIWDKAWSVFFFEGRLKFFHVSGQVGNAANAPSCLVAYGGFNVRAIQRASDSKMIKGKHIILRGEKEHD